MKLTRNASSAWMILITAILMLGGASNALALGPPNLSYSAPITITRGGTYSGNWKSTSANVWAVTINTTEPVIIQNCVVVGPADLIRAPWGANVTIRNCRGYGQPGGHENRFYAGSGMSRILIENNYMEQTSGMTLEGVNSSASEVRVLRNVARNIDCRDASGNKGMCNFVGLDKVTGVANIEIAWNQVINDPGNSNVEDNINFYKSGGTASSHAKVHNNYVQGGYPVDPTDPTHSGTGMITDSGGDGSGFVSQFVDAYNNQFVSQGNTGMSIAHGHDIQYFNNRIVSSAQLPDGRKVASNFAGMQIHSYYGGAQFYNNNMRNQTVAFVTPRYSYSVPTLGRNDYRTDGPYCAGCGEGVSHLPNPVTLQTEQAEWAAWKNKVASNGVSIGANGQGPGSENVLFGNAPDPAPAPAPTAAPAPAPTAAPAPAPDPGTWTTIGYENEFVTVPTDSTVRYGANGIFIQKILSGRFEIDNVTFGRDPVPGVTKYAQILGTISEPAPAPTTTPAPAPGTWTTIGYENEFVTVPTNSTVRYGANGIFIQKILSGRFEIDNVTFGRDPVPGVTKYAQILGTISAPAPAPAPGTVYIRGINFGGGSVTVDGRVLSASSGAPNLAMTGVKGTFSSQGVSLTPSVADAAKAAMVRSSVWGNQLEVNLSGLSNGLYQVYLYNWEDNFPATFSVSFEGQTVATGVNSGSAGSWKKLGPYNAQVSDGSATIKLSGGDANLSGLELHRLP